MSTIEMVYTVFEHPDRSTFDKVMNRVGCVNAIGNNKVRK